MKRLKIMVFLLALAVNLKAENLTFNLWGIDLFLPFAKTEVTNLYDVIGKKGFTGVETPIIAYDSITASVGAVSDLDLNGLPYVGLQTSIDEGIFSQPLSIGIWVGRDFRTDVNRAGIKASIALWDKR